MDFNQPMRWEFTYVLEVAIFRVIGTNSNYLVIFLTLSMQFRGSSFHLLMHCFSILRSRHYLCHRPIRKNVHLVNHRHKSDGFCSQEASRNDRFLQITL